MSESTYCRVWRTATCASQPAPSTGLDTAPNDGNSDAGGVGLEEGLLIGGGLAAALSVAYLLHQRRRDRGFRPGTPDIDDATDNTNLDGDRLYRSGGGGERAACACREPRHHL